MEQQTVDIRLMPADHRALLKVARHTIGLIRYVPLAVSVIVALIASSLGWLFAGVVLHLGDGPAAIAGLLLFYVLFFFLYIRLGRIIARKAYLPDGSFKAPMRVTAEENGVRVESENYLTELKWKGIKRVVETPAHVFLMLDIMSGYVIPKRCFRDAQAQADFLATVRSFTGHTA